MRRILVDAARRRQAAKRGSGVAREELKEEHWVEQGPSEELLAVDDALDLLAKEDPSAANLVKLRYFVGMTMQEATDTIGMPLRSGEALWTYARAWLRRQLGKQNSNFERP
jgi:RNA polymerase sigma factor (TIGR02999 family)